MRKCEKYLLVFSSLSIILFIISVILNNLVLSIISLALIIFTLELFLKVKKEYQEVDCLVKILTKLITSSEDERKIQGMRQDLIGQTTTLQRIIYRVEYKRRLE
jgi:c-di-AMP phosphodiesterase-like protein